MSDIKLKADQIRKQFLEEVISIGSDKIEALHSAYLGRKGSINSLFSLMGKAEPELRKKLGQVINNLKNEIETKLNEAKLQFVNKEKVEKAPDLSMDAYPIPIGTRHPLTKAMDDIIKIFTRLGFDIATGYEVETDWFNFESLNFPPNHPARDMQDTFYTGENTMLRTHTSPVQTRYMTANKPPVRVIAPGRVYRNEAISARSYCLFNQIEGLYVDKNVSFSDLKTTLDMFCRMYFGPSVKTRFRTSYFPFTEPSAEMDVSCFLCGGKGCRVCKKTGWLEILGCGMVDPNV
ncbi:MAG: phenylalanine--tRNA ligase subunit alpha, partial [Candidatus Marinimicrobia bacterium]|nr:phenylalanine--tRNA ligase subunit alpha [Candidatus Neomarinimicrobiota bacterium]